MANTKKKIQKLIVLTPDKVFDSMLLDYIIACANTNGEIFVLRKGITRESIMKEMLENTEFTLLS